MSKKLSKKSEPESSYISDIIIGKKKLKERKQEFAQMSNKKLADCLHEHNDYRRGIGKYEWNEDPTKEAKPPYTATEYGLMLDEIEYRLREGK